MNERERERRERECERETFSSGFNVCMAMAFETVFMSPFKSVDSCSQISSGVTTCKNRW